MRALKVYGWQGWRSEAGARSQTREVVAATSGVSAAHIAGFNRPGQLFNFDETGSSEEIRQALADPGVIFWHPLDEILSQRRWHTAGPVREAPEPSV